MSIDRLAVETWGEVFKHFPKVERVNLDTSVERLDIFIEGRENILHATARELNESLYKFSFKPHEVVSSFLKKQGILVPFVTIKWFLATCSMIMRLSMMSHFPLRGAIGGGDFYKDGEIIVSSALVDAHDHEIKQDWLGAVLTPSALKLIEKATARGMLIHPLRCLVLHFMKEKNDEQPGHSLATTL